MTDVLPPGWAWAQVQDIADTQLGKMLSAKSRVGLKPVSYLRNKNVRWGHFDFSDLGVMDFSPDEQIRFDLQPGDLLVCEGGEVGRTAIWTGAIEECFFQKALHRVRPKVSESGPYLRYYLEHCGRNNLFAAHTTGSTIAHLPQEDLRRLCLPAPPVNEQRRIVSAIEEQLSRLDGAVRLIEWALRRLALIRRAVLGDVMPEPLPAGWKLLTVDEAGTVELGRQRSPKYHSGPNMKPYFRVANVHEDRIDLGDVKEMDFPPEHLARHELRPGDILLNEGQSPEFVGRPAMYRGEMPGVCFTNSLIRFRPFDFIDGEYALLVFLRHLRFGRFQREAQITTNIAHMAAGRFRRVEFPVPPLDEQRDIVEAVRRQLSLLDAFEAELRTALRRSGTLRRAILAAAFRGELVPQDPADEPAAVLLARIASERPAATPRTRRKNGA